jgi:hypothetical protein
MQRDADMRFIENDLPYLPTEQCMRLSMMHGLKNPAYDGDEMLCKICQTTPRAIFPKSSRKGC